MQASLPDGRAAGDGRSSCFLHKERKRTGQLQFSSDCRAGRRPARQGARGGPKSPPKMILVESRSWRDRNLKFGPNCDLEVDNLEKIKNLARLRLAKFFIFFQIIHLQITIWAKF